MGKGKVLVTGATGYVGGRLVPRLLEQGYDVRVLVRDKTRLVGREWENDVEVVEADVLEPSTLPSALKNIWAAYYLIHSMSGHDDFHERDLSAARNFGSEAKNQGVERIIYLGGLGDAEADLSKHLRSRQQTGEALREADVPVTEFRAGIIVGSGSVSFEMIRHLTERIPIMICPRWVFTQTHPIAIRNILAYLIESLSVPESAGEIIEVGGKDKMSYQDMLLTYAEVRDLHRVVIPVPVLTPTLSSRWVQFVTPIPNDIARPLIEGLKNEAVADTTKAKRLFPDIEILGYKTAVSLAVNRYKISDVETSWHDALVSSEGEKDPVIFDSHEGMLFERRERIVNATQEDVYAAFTSLGGTTGWLGHNWLWRIRAFMDAMIGGVGFRRGRRHPQDLRVGEALDFWRVEELDPPRLMRLRAEMKMPGKGWLQYKAEPHPDGGTRLIQTAFFDSKGLFGLMYWYSIYPIHGLVFSDMIDGVAKIAENHAQQRAASPAPA